MGKADSWGDECTLELQVHFNLGPTACNPELSVSFWLIVLLTRCVEIV